MAGSNGKKLKVAINGFGRIGRLLFRAGMDHLDIVAVNDLCDAKVSAHLLKYDSTHRTYAKNVSAEENHMVVDGKKIRYTSIKNPEELPWKELGVEIVLEC